MADGLISGKAGVLYRLTDAANVYFSYGSAVTPPGTANFTLSAQPNNQNNPNVKPQESRNYELGGKVGLYDNRLSLSAALFRTDNENVIFTVDATAIPPVFNQDDGQRVNGLHDRLARADHAALADARQLRVSEYPADQPELREQRKPPHADAGILGQPVDDLRLSASVSRWAAVSATWMRCS